MLAGMGDWLGTLYHKYSFGNIHWLSGHSTLDRATYQKRQMKKGSGNLGRAHSASSVNLQHKGTRVLNTSKEIDH